MGLAHTKRIAEGARAILLALVLVLQGLVPAAALAQDEARGPAAIAICTGEGLKLVHTGSPHHRHGFAGLACEQCVMASLAMVASPPPVEMVRSQAVRFVYLPASERPSTRPRAPPRPPSRGPPIPA